MIAWKPQMDHNECHWLDLSSLFYVVSHDDVNKKQTAKDDNISSLQ